MSACRERCQAVGLLPASPEVRGGAKPRVFHILWNNKFELFDRTLLMLYYRLLGRRVVLTAHNVNAAKRDWPRQRAQPL